MRNWLSAFILIVISTLLCLVDMTLTTNAQTTPQTRSSLNSYNNSNFFANAHGSITGPLVNQSNANLIASMGLLNDSNTFTGTNIFTGSVTLPAGIAATNIGTLSGDLTGTLPSPTIAAGAITGAKMSAGSAATNLGGGTAQTGILVGNGTSAATGIAPGSGVAAALAQPVTGAGEIVLSTSPSIVSPAITGVSSYLDVNGSASGPEFNQGGSFNFTRHSAYNGGNVGANLATTRFYNNVGQNGAYNPQTVEMATEDISDCYSAAGTANCLGFVSQSTRFNTTAIWSQVKEVWDRTSAADPSTGQVISEDDLFASGTDRNGSLAAGYFGNRIGDAILLGVVTSSYTVTATNGSPTLTITANNQNVPTGSALNFGLVNGSTILGTGFSGQTVSSSSGASVTLSANYTGTTGSYSVVATPASVEAGTALLISPKDYGTTVGNNEVFKVFIQGRGTVENAAMDFSYAAFNGSLDSGLSTVLRFPQNVGISFTADDHWRLSYNSANTAMCVNNQSSQLMCTGTSGLGWNNLLGPLYPLHIRASTNENFLVGGPIDLGTGVTIFSENDAITTVQPLEVFASAFRLNASSVSINGTAAVSCSAGTPSASFTVVNGFVTHC